MSVISDFPLDNSCKTIFFKTWSSNYTSINNNNTIINHNWRSRFPHLDKLFTCFPLTVKYRHTLADDKTYLYFTDYWFLLRYTVIIYKFTQGNLGTKKIARSRFQLPVKKKNRKLRHWRRTARFLLTSKSYGQHINLKSHHCVEIFFFQKRKWGRLHISFCFSDCFIRVPG